ncbi:MAG: hypothetical protein HC853_15710 [Anaerolineae bacterium]|nr:hypothetical protein [Anaerolineae bacterium]
MCQRHLNLRVALVACLLFAVAPWAVQLARNLRPVALPATTALMLLGLLEAVHPRASRKDLAGLSTAQQNPSRSNLPGLAGATNDWGWPLASLGFALSAGNHLAAMYLAPVFVIALGLALFTRRLRINRITLLALLPVLILAGSYLWYDANNGWRNISGYLRMSGEPATVNDEALRFALWGSGGAHLSDFTGGAFLLWQAQAPLVFDWIDTLQIGLLLIGLVVCAIKLARTRRAVFFLLLLGFVLPVALQLRHARPLQMHYFTLLYPATFVLMALAASELSRFRVSGFKVKWLVSVLLVVVVGWQAFTTFRFYDFIERNDTSAGGYGLPVRNSLGVASVRAPDKIVVSTGGDPHVNEWATVFDVLLAGQPHRFTNANEGLILREQPAQYIFTPGTDEAYEQLMRYAQVTLTRTVPVRVGSRQNYVIVETQGVNLAQVQSAPAQPWQSGTQLLGYAVQQTDPLNLQTFVKVWRPAPAGADYHWYHHLYEGDVRIGQADVGGVDAANWREGDILLHWVRLPLPTDAANLSVRIGSYTYPQLQPVMLVDEAGDVVGDGVSLRVTSDE